MRQKSIVEEALTSEELETWRMLNGKIAKFRRDQNRTLDYKPRKKRTQTQPLNIM